MKIRIMVQVAVFGMVGWGIVFPAAAQMAFNLNNGWVDDGTEVRLKNANDDVGIGTATPAGKLHVTGGNVIVDDNLGIGTTTPQAKLEVTGGVKLGNDLSACDPLYAGTLRWTGSSLDVCNGSDWGVVYCIVGKNQDAPGASCKQLHDSGCASTDGLYWVDPNGGSSLDAFQVYCDMTTDGGGWMLVESYNKTAGDNPPVSPGTWPLSFTSSLSHVDNISQYGFSQPTEVRLYCSTSLHSRVIHYKTTNPNVISSVYSTTLAGCNDLKSNVTLLPGHTANLPQACTGGDFPASNQIFGYEFPMYLTGQYHWTTRGFGVRWECDDYAGGSGPATNHLVWVR